jgi:hypothetical protein
MIKVQNYSFVGSIIIASPSITVSPLSFFTTVLKVAINFSDLRAILVATADAFNRSSINTGALNFSVCDRYMAPFDHYLHR